MKYARRIGCFFTMLLLVCLPSAYAVPNRAYVSLGFPPDSIAVIDTSTNAVVTSIAITDPRDIVISPDGTSVYVSSATTNTVFVIDTSTNMIATSFPVPNPKNFVITPDGTQAYIISGGAGPGNDGVRVFDLTTHALVATILMAISPSSQIVITPDGTKVYVTNDSVSQVFEIKTSLNMVTDFIAVNGALGIAINGTNGYVTRNVPPALVIFDTTTNAFIGSPILLPFAGPGFVAVTPNAQQAYVTYAASSSVSPIDLTTNMVNTAITVDGFASQIAITPNGQTAYVTSSSNSLFVINTATNTIQTTIPVGSSSASIAITPSSLFPPLQLTGNQTKNDTGVQFELFNTISWEANPESIGITGYFVYRDGIKIATLNASELQYKDHNRKKGATTVYSVTSFTEDGSESDPASIQVR